MHTTLTSKGQVTIPKAIRERLGLAAGDRLRFHFQDDGRVVVEPERQSPLGRLPGMLKDYVPEKPVSVDDMRRGARRRVAAKYGHESES